MLDIGERLLSYEPLWETWRRDRYIDSGSFAKVYALREDFYGDVRYSAVKVVPVILTNSSAAQKYGFEKAVEQKKRQLAEEIKNMLRLGEKPYLVHCLNYAFKDIREGGEVIGFDLLIQMELLTPLTEYIRQNGSLSDENIKKCAMNIAEALRSMHGINMLHRDIKVQNIYLNGAGDFLLGDFGVSKQMPSDSFRSLAGTEPFIAPEVFRVRQTRKNYQKTADIYSYGITIYYLMNGNMLPFVDENSTLNDVEDAVSDRLDGKPFPPPRYGPKRLKPIVMKCCEYLPENRYQSIDEVISALDDAVNNAPRDIYGTLDADISVRPEKNPPSAETSSEKEVKENSPSEDAEAGASDAVRRLESGGPEAWNELGDIYYFGRGVEKNEERAFYWYSLSAEADNPTAQNSLGFCFAYGKGTKKDSAKAFYWYGRAAKQGSGNGQFNLALCYESGQGTEKDLKMAAYYYFLSAQQGSAKAKYYLGLCYELGKGVEKNPEYALRLYREAADAGNKRAREKLGI